MGLSKSKQTTKSNETATVAPNAVYAPQIDAAASTFKPAYEMATANTTALMPRVNSVLDYYGNTLAGGQMGGNPYLDSVIGKTRSGVTDQVNSQFSQAGRYGSGMHAGILADRLASAEGGLRYQDYATERGYQDNAARGVLSAAGVSAALPQAASGAYADQVRALLGQYTTGNQSGTQTTTQSPSIMSILMQMGSNAAKAAAGGA